MKTKLFLMLLFISSIALAQTPIDEVLHYSFTGGNLVNEANPGTGDLTQTGNAATFVADHYGTSGNAIELNGDQFTGGNVTSTHLSLSFWIKPNSVTSTERIIQMYNGPNGLRLELAAGNRLGWVGSLYNSSGAQSNDSRSTVVNNLYDGDWHHIVLRGTRHSVQDWRSIHVYIDGVLNNDLTGDIVLDSNITSFLGNGQLAISPSSVTNYNKSIDDIKVFNRALNGTEIIALYNLCENCYALDTSIVGDGTITTSPAASSPYGTYASGTTVTLAATANTGSVFYQWTGDASGNTSTTTVVMNDDKDVTANFVIPSLSHVYVDKNASGNNDGATWTNAFVNLHDALVSGATTIWVAKGMYKPDVSDRNVSFNIVTNIYGGFAGTEVNLADRDLSLIHTTNETILSGDLNGDDAATVAFGDTTRDDNSYHVVEVTQEDLVIDGLTIQDGYANATTGDDRFGAGIFKTASIANFTLKNSIIKNNVAYTGAGLSMTTTAALSTISIDACIIENNLANAGAGGDFHHGSGNGAVMNVKITNTLFKANKTADDVANNRDGVGAPAVRIRAYWSMQLYADLINNTFVNNSSLGSEWSSDYSVVGISRRTGIFQSFAIANNIFWGNTANGGVISPAIGRTSSTYTRLTVSSNRVVTNNTDENNFLLISGTTNTNVVNPNLDANFQLTSTSPALDIGDNSYVTTASDVLGNQRIFNTTVDLGAHEYNSTLGVNDFQFAKNEIKLYPNPTTSVLNIKMKANLKQATVYSVLGAKVLNTTSKSLNTANLKSGLYLITIEDEAGNVSTKRFIKQ
ncbi:MULTISPECIES: LamG-like jellyroll fold domain-containing protein [unclassified Lacinutrix]